MFNNFLSRKQKQEPLICVFANSSGVNIFSCQQNVTEHNAEKISQLLHTVGPVYVYVHLCVSRYIRVYMCGISILNRRSL